MDERVVNRGMKKILILGSALFMLLQVNAQSEQALNAMISPNPVRDYCEIRTSVPAEVRVMDLKGSVLFEMKEERFHDVDMTQFEEGIYFVYLIGKEEVQTLRLVKTSSAS